MMKRCTRATPAGVPRGRAKLTRRERQYRLRPMIKNIGQFQNSAFLSLFASGRIDWLQFLSLVNQETAACDYTLEVG